MKPYQFIFMLCLLVVVLVTGGCASIEEQAQRCIDKGETPVVYEFEWWLTDCDCDVPSTFHPRCDDPFPPRRIIMGKDQGACGMKKSRSVKCIGGPATPEFICMLTETCDKPAPPREPQWHKPLEL